jgi:hypothetical protein
VGRLGFRDPLGWHARVMDGRGYFRPGLLVAFAVVFLSVVDVDVMPRLLSLRKICLQAGSPISSASLWSGPCFIPPLSLFCSPGFVLWPMILL